MPERSHLSIGEVLSLLREEFPDVTISKIRFLESQGLVDPERTPSGYRKFYEHDVERLRWILRQQREHFLPLKVIRGRLTEQEGEGPLDSDLGAQPSESSREEAEAAAERPVAGVATAAGDRPSAEADRPGPRRDHGPGRGTPPTPSLFAALHAAPAETSGPVRPAAEPPLPVGESGPAQPAPIGPKQGGPTSRSQEAHPARAESSRSTRPVAVPVPAPHAGDDEDDAESYTAEELAGAAGTETALVQELKQYGLILPHAVVAGVAYYDAGSLDVVRAASQFARHGVEARHLRPWRNAADREADLFQQVVLPLLRQRNPQARRQALDTLAELSAAGAALRAALVERAVRDIR